MLTSKYKIGEQSYNSEGYLMTIVEYKSNKEVVVRFENGYLTKTDYNSFKKGLIRNRFAPSVWGVGIIGELKSGENYQHTKEYMTWKRMLERCFSDKWKTKYPHYKDTTCCEEWFYYPNFYNWIINQENYDEWLHGKYWALDKDIIKKGNQIYSPDNCCLVPQYVNQLFTKSRTNKNGHLGVFKCDGLKKYEARYIDENKQKVICGGFDTAEDAYKYYQKAKKEVVRKVAEREYSFGNISTKCYEAMINYEF